MYRSLLDYPADAAPAGWYPSVKVAGAWRWWDGVSFTQDHCWDPGSRSWIAVGRRRNDRRWGVGMMAFGFVAWVAGLVLAFRPGPYEPSLIRQMLLAVGPTQLFLGSTWVYRARQMRRSFDGVRSTTPLVSPTGEPWPPPSS